MFLELLWVTAIWPFLFLKDFALHVGILLPIFIIVIKLVEKETFSFFSTVVFRRKDYVLFSCCCYYHYYYYYLMQHFSQSWHSASLQTWQVWWMRSWLTERRINAHKAAAEALSWEEVSVDHLPFLSDPKQDPLHFNSLLGNLLNPLWVFWFITAIVHLHCTFSKHMQSLHTFCYCSGTDL